MVGVNRRTWTRWRFGRTVPARDGDWASGSGHDRDPERGTPALGAVPVRAGARHRGPATGTAQHARYRSPAWAGRLEPQPWTGPQQHRGGPVLLRRGWLRPGWLGRGCPRWPSTPSSRAAVWDGLHARWSTEQISHALPRVFPDDPLRQLATATTYQERYATVLSGNVTCHLTACAADGAGADHTGWPTNAGRTRPAVPAPGA